MFFARIVARRPGERPRELRVRLVACPKCHTQYDVTPVAAPRFTCRCGETLENLHHAPVDAEIQRCGACGAQVSGAAADCTYCGSTIVRDPGRLSLLCPECYARNAEQARFCGACGVGFRPEKVRVDGYELPCPAGHGLMPPRDVAGVAVNECRTCNGLWASGDSFDLLIHRALEARRGADPQKLAALASRASQQERRLQRVEYRSCPICDGMMARRNFRGRSGVILDSCPDHGTWLDADELEKVVSFVASDGGRSASAEPRDRSQAEGRASAAFARILAEERTGRRPEREPGVVGSLVDALFDLLS